MARQQKKYHILYKITCNFNGRWYIGIHSTNNIEDGYFGSGRRIGYSLKKHGIENHKREILEFCDDRKTLLEKESQYVTAETLNDPLCMNLMRGGSCGNGYEMMSSEERKNEYRRRLVEANKLKWKNPQFKEKHKASAEKTFASEKYQTNIKEVHKRTWQHDGHKEKMRQKKLDLWQNPEYAEKMKEKVRETNARNIGMIWVHHDNEKAKRIKPEELDSFLANGYFLGKGAIDEAELKRRRKLKHPDWTEEQLNKFDLQMKHKQALKDNASKK